MEKNKILLDFFVVVCKATALTSKGFFQQLKLIVIYAINITIFFEHRKKFPMENCQFPIQHVLCP